MPSLSPYRDNQSDPFLYWFIFYKVYWMCHYVNNLDKVSIANKSTFDLPQDTTTIQSTFDNLINLPSNLHGFQIQTYPVYNFNEGVFCHRGIWGRIFTPTSGAMSQGSDGPKIGSLSASGS